MAVGDHTLRCPNCAAKDAIIADLQARLHGQPQEVAPGQWQFPDTLYDYRTTVWTGTTWLA